MLGIRKTNYLV